MNRGSGRAITSGVPRMRFNEAPIHESGKERPRAVYEVADVASMRPRFMNRGRGPCGCRPALSAGFNEAPIHESGKAGGVIRLQDPAVASMRPRFMNRGRSGSRVHAIRSDAASMRPRFMNRGSDLAVTARFARASLQ